jgi:D-beta-D-heptose 7-phosphate kinase/D-beta-D-heptose 1-phosphate adenosyltransferase
VKDTLRADGVGTSGIVIDETRQTTRKVRIVTGRKQQVARIDYETDREVGGQVEAALMAALEKAASSAKAIVVSDYLKGSITRPLMERAVGLARDRQIPVLVDPKIPHLDYY